MKLAHSNDGYLFFKAVRTIQHFLDKYGGVCDSLVKERVHLELFNVLATENDEEGLKGAPLSAQSNHGSVQD